MPKPIADENVRAERLLDAQDRAAQLFGEIERRAMIRPGVEWYITPGSNKPMRRTDPNGLICHWILEIHLTDPDRGFGGFYEQLLDLS